MLLRNTRPRCQAHILCYEASFLGFFSLNGDGQSEQESNARKEASKSSLANEIL